MRTLATLFCALLAACGGEETTSSSGGGGSGTGNGSGGGSNKQGGGGGASAKTPDPEARAKAEQARDAAKIAFAQAKADLEELKKRQAEEAKSLPSTAEISATRRRLSQLRKDGMRQSAKRRQMERRLKATEKHAASAASDELRALKAQRKSIKKKVDAADNVFRKELAESRAGKVDESPVKIDLDTCRAIKLQWFDVTADARRGKGAAAKDKINSTFREWLGASPKRQEICTKVLTQALAPKGKTPTNYDFSDLGFFLLLELYENELDKLNVAVELKVAKETEDRVDTLMAELDAVDNKIALAEQKGGSEFEEYIDLKDRIKGVRKMDDDLQESYAAERELATQVHEIKDRHFKELEAVETAIAKTARNLKATQRKLRSIPR